MQTLLDTGWSAEDVAAGVTLTDAVIAGSGYCQAQCVLNLGGKVATVDKLLVGSGTITIEVYIEDETDSTQYRIIDGPAVRSVTEVRQQYRSLPFAYPKGKKLKVIVTSDNASDTDVGCQLQVFDLARCWSRAV